LRIEQAEHLLVADPCVSDTVRQWIATIDGQDRRPRAPVSSPASGALGRRCDALSLTDVPD
jgi:hypothetical protein